MTPNKQFAVAERFENLRLAIVLAFVFIGLNNAVQAIAYHYPPAEFPWVKMSNTGLDVALLVCCLLVVIGWFRLGRVTPRVRALLLEEFVHRDGE